MKKNWKAYIYGMAVASILSMTACSADDETGDFLFTEEETETENLSLAEDEEQDTEDVNTSLAENEMQDTETAHISSTKKEIQDAEAANHASAKKETQDAGTPNPSSAKKETQNTGTANDFSEEEKQDVETEDNLIFDNPILLEDYYNTPDGRTAIEADFEDLADEGMSVTISVIMDEINVTVKYEDGSLLTEGIKETLAQKLESMNDRFWKQTISYDEKITWRCVLRVSYVDPEGNVLAEQSYSAE